jgi:hypothetical protein
MDKRLCKAIVLRVKFKGGKMALSKRIQKRNQNEEEKAYKVIIVVLVIALAVACIVANKLAVDRVQPVYDEVYNVNQK